MINIIRHIPTYLKASPVESGVIAVLVLALGYFALPLNVDATTNLGALTDKTVALQVAAMQNETKDYGTLPVADLRGAPVVKYMQVSAYTSRVEECDSTPFITASQTHVRDGVVATNQFPFGTRIKMPELYGDKVFIVEDRMNTRYTNNVDIWMDDLTAARHFGRKTVKIEVYRAK
jgi:3D (Asp-Asp-Asp) domain-containing protein